MEIYRFAQEIILDAGEFIRNRMIEDFNIDSKMNANDLVTDVDKETEQFLFDKIEERYPEHRILGEEGAGADIEDADGVLWIIDPIDGTLNFVHQLENFAVSIGIYIDGKPYAGLILDVMKNDLYHAAYEQGAYKNDEVLHDIEESSLKSSLISTNANWLVREGINTPFIQVVKDARSVRSLGSAALEFVNVVRGTSSAALFYRLHPWDFAGGIILLNEVGGITTTLLGDEVRLLKTNSILAANKKIHGELTEYFKADEAFIKNHKEFHKL
ncbi:inositol monophosphatase family protein [Salinicoccus halitifaciens]|uniref:inositol-phosphate phosphatase n=1 Tax=Salinicoccus halitifaciens TaxID=1073415 RepID=A0ABV2E7J6_9STAP|nr:inositol monophosphatase family protein [Salinicoccus halitifaciens]MCD2136543.1 inositol monophosphatase family protein [Salinicoccus halitifaciens]